MRPLALILFSLAVFAARTHAQERSAESPDMVDGARAGLEVDSGLQLERVLASLREHHPSIAAERAAVMAAQGEALAARGEFDTTLNVLGRGTASGYYDARRLDVVVEQPTPLLGSSVYAGYRLTRGKVPSYYGEQNTLDRGEVRGGVRVPLLQDLRVDSRRAGIRSTAAQLTAQQSTFDELLLDMEREAADKYFVWVAAGKRLAVLTRLVELAELRDEQIRIKVSLGALAPVEQLDNTRSLLERRRQLVVARRSFEKASLDLSLFLRVPSGSPLVPGTADLPDEAPTLRLRSQSLDAAEKAALEKRPEIAAYDALAAALRIERDLAQNRTLPRLDSFVEVSKDIGAQSPDLAPTLRPTVVELGVNLSVPLWLRKARGKMRAAEAKLHAAQQKARLVQDKVVTEVRDAWSQLEAAKERVEVAGRAASLAEQIAVGERERFELGSSTILFVNLREQTAADARIALIDAVAESQYSIARLLTIVGESLADETADVAFPAPRAARLDTDDVSRSKHVIDAQPRRPQAD